MKKLKRFYLRNEGNILFTLTVLLFAVLLILLDLIFNFITI